MNPKVLLSLLLACSVLIPLTIAQVARSQTITTVTSIQYFTTSSATTVYSTIQITSTSTQPVRYVLTPADYKEQTGSFSLSQEEMITSESRFSGGVDIGCRYYDYFLINTTAGQEIRGHFEVLKSRLEAVIRSIDFFILKLDQLQVFKSSKCGYGNWVWLMQVSASSYDLDWIVPQRGEYALLFLSRDSYFNYNFSGDYLYFTAKVYSPTVQSSPIAYTSTRTYTLQSSQIVISTQPSINPPPSTNNYLIASIAIITIGFITFITLRMKRQAQS